MATFDVTIVETKKHTYRVDARSGYEASAKAMLIHVDPNGEMPLRVDLDGDPRMSKPTLVTAEGQEALALDAEEAEAE